MKIIATIESRLNSKRLPKKHLYKINGKLIINLLIERLKKIKNLSKIVLSTTNNEIDNELIKIAKKNRIGFYRGSEENVLERVIKSAEKYSADAILQVSGDCPLIDYSLVNDQIEMFKVNNPDISTPYWFNFPGGVCAPIIKLSALHKSLKNSKTISDYEHVTNYIFNNQKKFKILYFLAQKDYKYPKLEFILDNYDDFLFLKNVMKFDKKNKFTTRELVEICIKNKISRKKKINRKNKDRKKFILNAL
jgi:spore coat polysaccharide biosynthesis protein SpsF